MKCGNSNDVICKEVVIIGNGPSGIALSYMLSGNIPYIVSNCHPDEMLSARLKSCQNKSLIREDLSFLATDLEGRSTNPISLLLDALLHPYADVGLDLEPLVEFKKNGPEVDHIVVGKGPPGGSWHKMDPHILTLSLDSWMALPGLPFNSRDSGEKRAFAHNVAKYYVQYVKAMQLDEYFADNVTVRRVVNLKHNKPDNWVDKVNCSHRAQLCIEPEIEVNHKTCIISNAINYLLRSNRKMKTHRCCKRPREPISPHQDQSPDRKITFFVNAHPPACVSSKTKRDRDSSISFCCDSKNLLCDSFYNNSFNSANVRNSYSLDPNQIVPSDCDPDWLIETFNMQTGTTTTYFSKYLVLANGASDLPNKLDLSRNQIDPEWMFHDLRSLERYLDEHVVSRQNAVVVVGAGLSAADAVIAARGRDFPVAHVFRNKSADLNKQLPENMYPEYHKVHQMMKDGGSTYPSYSAYPEYTLTKVDEADHTVVLTSKTGDTLKLRVCCVAVLIGSRPDFSFLTDVDLGVKRGLPIDCKTNTIKIDKLTHLVDGFNNLFAIGPLSGDNFVRFIPGGALAVLSEIYKQNYY